MKIFSHNTFPIKKYFEPSEAPKGPDSRVEKILEKRRPTPEQLQKIQEKANMASGTAEYWKNEATQLSKQLTELEAKMNRVANPEEKQKLENEFLDMREKVRSAEEIARSYSELGKVEAVRLESAKNMNGSPDVGIQPENSSEKNTEKTDRKTANTTADWTHQTPSEIPSDPHLIESNGTISGYNQRQLENQVRLITGQFWDFMKNSGLSRESIPALLGPKWAQIYEDYATKEGNFYNLAKITLLMSEKILTEHFDKIQKSNDPVATEKFAKTFYKNIYSGNQTEAQVTEILKNPTSPEAVELFKNSTHKAFFVNVENDDMGQVGASMLQDFDIQPTDWEFSGLIKWKEGLTKIISFQTNAFTALDKFSRDENGDYQKQKIVAANKALALQGKELYASEKEYQAKKEEVQRQNINALQNANNWPQTKTEKQIATDYVNGLPVIVHMKTWDGQERDLKVQKNPETGGMNMEIGGKQIHVPYENVNRPYIEMLVKMTQNPLFGKLFNGTNNESYIHFEKKFRLANPTEKIGKYPRNFYELILNDIAKSAKIPELEVHELEQIDRTMTKLSNPTFFRPIIEKLQSKGIIAIDGNIHYQKIESALSSAEK